ncbi:MAG TPA: NAD-dependent epimerase/dehydratase family protein [Candidatus Dormibacteraeota bacterium]|nr:NAD-dependent epimerase/dehydratase family protein [Candidatus Dormibacteraeota bacterium]
MSAWKLKNVLVTGATGLLGPWLTALLLEERAAVVCLVRDQVPGSNFHRMGLDRQVVTVHGDLVDGRLLERTLNEYEIEVVIHLAAQAIVGAANRSPLGSFESNIRGTWSLLEACRVTDSVRAVVVASSDKAYGEQPDLPYTEAMPLDARHPYDVSKAAADMLAKSYFHTYGLPVAITRCGNLYGGGDLNFNRIVPGTIRSALLGERPVIRSDGRSVRDYFYVEDAANACLRLAERLLTDEAVAGQPFNFSSEEPLTVIEMARLVLAAVGVDLELDIRNEARHEIERQYLSAARAREVLSWEPRFTVPEALQRTVAWYREYLRDLAG